MMFDIPSPLTAGGPGLVPLLTGLDILLGTAVVALLSFVGVAAAKSREAREGGLDVLKYADLKQLAPEERQALLQLELLNRGVDLRNIEEIREAFREAGIQVPKKVNIGAQYRPNPANRNLTRYRVVYDGIDDVLDVPPLYEGYDRTAAEQAFFQKVQEARANRENIFVVVWAGDKVVLGFNAEEGHVHVPKDPPPGTRRKRKKS